MPSASSGARTLFDCVIADDKARQSVHKGPKLVKIGLPTLKGVALTGDFEGVVTFGAACNTEPVYNTFKLHSPERFVLDIRHPSGSQCRTG
ncbi:hypothetical protein AR457_34590 [Streptomyces agglomeratus]|nr:hypothetical protein BGK70_02085 [Streptomyces agglomeratus]OEJ48490.1 hypothetical protein AR457_34590 [Streptomyces agglomeratus]